MQAELDVKAEGFHTGLFLANRYCALAKYTSASGESCLVHQIPRVLFRSRLA